MNNSASAAGSDATMLQSASSLVGSGREGLLDQGAFEVRKEQHNFERGDHRIRDVACKSPEDEWNSEVSEEKGGLAMTRAGNQSQ